ncbi:MAG: hypothetical protein Kow0074_12060 [Candidatus Zixiibacteriota bacterium]
MLARVVSTTHSAGVLLRRSVLVAVGIHLCAGCGLESPKAPTWTIDAQVPLASRSFDVPYIIDRIGIDELQWSEDAGVTFHVARTLDSIFVADNLRLSSLSTNLELPLESVHFAVGASVSRTLTLDELHPDPVGLITAFSGEVRQSLEPVSDFTTAAVEDGTLQVTVDNSLGLTLDSVTVALFDADNLSPFATIPIDGPLVTGSSTTITTSVPESTIGAQWDLALAFYTPGGTILTADDKSVTVTVVLPDGIRVSSGTGAVSAFSYTTANTILLSSDHVVHSADIASGVLTVHWQNETPVPVEIDWQCSDISRDTVPLSGHVAIQAHSDYTQTVSLDGYEADLTAHASQLTIDVTVSSPGSDGIVVGIDASSVLAAETSFSDVVLSSGTLALARTTQSIPSLQTTIEWPNGLESIGLAEGTATVEITSSLPWPVTVNGQIQSPGGESIDFEGLIPAAGQDVAVSTLEIGRVDALLDPIPQTLTVTGTASYGDGVTSAYVSNTDYLVGRLVFTAPAHLLLDSSAVHGDPEPVELADNQGDNLDGRFVGGQITIDVSNHLPLSADILISIASDSLRLTDDPELLLGPSRIDAAITNASGQAVEASQSTLTFMLDEHDVSLFARDSIWVTETLILNGPSAGVPAVIELTDYVDWNATAVLAVRMGDRDNAEDNK